MGDNNFLPVDSGYVDYRSTSDLRAGWYILKITDARESRTAASGLTSYRLYRSEIVIGPNWDMSNKGVPFTDRIREDAAGASEHMKLFVAVYGSLANVKIAAAPYGNRIPAEILTDRIYMARLSERDKWIVVAERRPYSQELWAELVARREKRGIVLKRRRGRGPAGRGTRGASNLDDSRFANIEIPEQLKGK